VDPDYQEPLDSLVSLGKEVAKDLLVDQDHLDHQVPQVHLDLQAGLEIVVDLAEPDLLVTVDSLDNQANKETKDPLDQLDQRDRLDKLV